MADELNNQYQGTQGHEQEVIKVEGLKASLQKMKDDLLGIPNTSEAVKYTQAEADAYNAQLTGALDDTTPLTAEQATAYNTAIPGATKEAGDTLSEAEANLYNATLDGAVTTDDVKTPAVPTKVKDYVDTEVAKKYTKPTNGIPKSDLASGVKTSLGKADTSVQGVAYDTTNKKITETIGSETTDVVTAYKIVEDGGGIQMKLLDLFSLAHDYSFKKNDALLVGGAIYKATADTTAPPFDFVFDANNSIVVERINGYDSPVVDNDSLNTGWEKVVEINDRYYVEQRADVLTRSLNHPYLTCTTAGGTAAKVVSHSNFILSANRTISVLFTNGFTTTSPTLNVNGTGAKAIKYFGSAIAPGKIRNNTILNMQYDGTNWNVLSIESLAGTPSMAVDLGLPSGLLWCDRNVGAAVPEEDGLYFSWGNTVGHPDDNSYIFSPTNYNSSPGSAVTQDLSLAYDGARANLGSPWRMPTKDECTELLSNCTVEDFTVNGKEGYLLTSNINGNTIFFPMSGGLSSFNITGCFIWSSSYRDSTYAWEIYADGSIGATLTVKNWGERSAGFQIRPVM